ncbi:hypothetical protein P7C70_g4033, partial [Phenoliferia sp. Uapishka_3]
MPSPLFVSTASSHKPSQDPESLPLVPNSSSPSSSSCPTPTSPSDQAIDYFQPPRRTPLSSQLYKVRYYAAILMAIIFSLVAFLVGLSIRSKGMKSLEGELAQWKVGEWNGVGGAEGMWDQKLGDGEKPDTYGGENVFAKFRHHDDLSTLPSCDPPAHPANPATIPFLPFSCTPRTFGSISSALPTYVKYNGPNATNATYEPLLLDRTALFEGTGLAVKRVLKRAIKSHLYGLNRLEAQDNQSLVSYEDEEPFRILVLGGSVSDCRGVNRKTECWHARLLDWFRRTLPLEGDLATPASRPTDLRRVPAHALINGAKSATGSAFFFYCFEEEMRHRGFDKTWGKGPDLIILEFGVNDVWTPEDSTSRDFGRLIAYLRTLPSNPAVITLESASLKTALEFPLPATAEYYHLPAVHFHDVPLLSTKNALFGSVPGLPSNSTLSYPDLFLSDWYHPNVRGHELLADTLIYYLEKQLCEAQADLMRTAQERIADVAFETFAVDPKLDVGRRTEEKLLLLPERPLFEPFRQYKKTPFEVVKSTCLRVDRTENLGLAKENIGWSRFWGTRKKGFLGAEEPGALITWEIEVGPRGEVLVDWLRNKSPRLGNVLVYLDGEIATGVTLAGWWRWSWSIGIPTIVFSNVSPGPHTITFELLPSNMSTNPSRGTAFRLIALITT